MLSKGNDYRDFFCWSKISLSRVPETRPYMGISSSLAIALWNQNNKTLNHYLSSDAEKPQFILLSRKCIIVDSVFLLLRLAVTAASVTFRVPESRIMSAEGGKANSAALRVQELTRQFGRPDPTSSPVANNNSPVHQKTLPKILSHIAKTPPTPENAENSKRNSENGIGNPPAHAVNVGDDRKTLEDDRESSSESEMEESALPATSIAQIRPMIRQPSKLESSDYVIGLDQLQEQVRRLALRRGFTLNIMVVGKSRCHHHQSRFIWPPFFVLSKGAVGWANRRSSTPCSAPLYFLVRTALGRDQNRRKRRRYVPLKQVCRLGRNTAINHFNIFLSFSSSLRVAIMRALFCSNAAIVEEGIRLNLTVTDTPGFGDRIDNTNWYNEIPFFFLM